MLHLIEKQLPKNLINNIIVLISCNTIHREKWNCLYRANKSDLSLQNLFANVTIWNVMLTKPF